MSLLDDLGTDLEQESAALDAAVAPLDDRGWNTATDAEGWSVRDTVAHLHASDRAGLAALRGEDLTAFVATVLAAGYDGPDLLTDWRSDRDALRTGVLTRPSEAGRIPWFGPPMSPASFLTARLMETWAHGVDVLGAQGLPLVPTARLRHVADLGVRTRGWSYTIRGLPVPPDAPFVELVAPDGTPWTWGEPDAADRVTGSALGFCLLVTQRRHPQDTDIRASGSDALQWLDIAQAYAGPPGSGRARFHE